MKKLYLIGDSIRMGYAPFVKAALEGKALVYWPDENCRFAAYTYYALGDWEHNMRVGEDTAVVHWNCGLHDVVHFAGDESVTPPEIYAYYLKRIYKRIKFLYPQAKQIFALSTPVNEERFSFWLSRKNSEIDEYNRTALEALSGLDIEINDLHSVVEPEFLSDASHMSTPEGREAMTRAVLKAVCPYLDVDYSSLTMPDFTDDKISESGVSNLLK